MKVYNEEEYLMISGIQHFAFCKRQWALIHIENQWEENLRTVVGRIMHEKAHDGPTLESRKNILLSREMRIFSATLGITGICDVVEFKKCKKEAAGAIQLFGKEGFYQLFPVEYKKGEPKINDADRLQLAAQAICLEEMMCTQIPIGYLYYGTIKRREKVEITSELRDKVRILCTQMHEFFERQFTPKVKRTKSCNACSLKNICLPKLMKSQSVHDYISKRIKDAEV